MAEKQGDTRLDRTPGGDVRGLEEREATHVAPKPDSAHVEHRGDSANPDTPAEGRDRPPASRGRDTSSPWLGGG